jgi:stage V sporulation protein B
MQKAARMLRDTAVLSGAALAMRGISLGFNVYLTRRLGAAALGLYGLMSSVYGFSITLSCSGVRLAATRLTTEAMSRGENPRRPFLFCALWGLVAGMLVGIGLFLLSDRVAGSGIGEPAAAPALRLLALGLPPLAVSSAMRGFFLARRQTARQSAVDLFELLFQIAATALALECFLPADAPSGLWAVALGSCLSEYASVVLALAINRSPRRHRRNSYKPGQPLPALARQFVRIVAPTAGSALFCSLLRTSGAAAYSGGAAPLGLWGRISAGLSLGRVSGMVLPVLYFPSAVLTALSSLLVPELTEAFVRGHRRTIRRVAGRALTGTAIFSIGLAAMAIGFANDLSLSVYGSAETALLMRVFAPLIPLVYLDSVVDGMLKGLDEQFRQMLYSLLDAALSLCLVWLLIPRWALMGYVATIFIAKSINAILSLARLVRTATLEIDLWRAGLLPLLCAAGSVAFCLPLPTAESLPALLLKLSACGGLYLGLLALTGCLSGLVGGLVAGPVQKMRRSADKPYMDML